MAWITVVTDAGRALLESYGTGGHTLDIVDATVGSGTIAEANLRIQTALTDEKDNASIISAKETEDGTKFKIQVGPATSAAYTAHQIGLWATLDDGARTLLLLSQDIGDGVSVPLKSVSPNFAFGLYVVLAVDNTGSLTVNIDESAYVSMGTLNDLLDGIEDEVDSLRPVSVQFSIRDTEYHSSNGRGDWHNPGTTWEAIDANNNPRYFTAPADRYASAYIVPGVTAKSSITEAYYDLGEDLVSAPFEYETRDDGWILLETKTPPAGNVRLWTMIAR